MNRHIIDALFLLFVTLTIVFGLCFFVTLRKVSNQGRQIEALTADLESTERLLSSHTQRVSEFDALVFSIPARISDHDRYGYAHAIDDACRKFNLSRQVIFETITRESNWEPYARGKAGEIGPMQVKPRTAEFVKSKGLWNGDDLTDPYQNITCGAGYIRYLMDTGKCEIAGYQYGHESEKAVK